VGGKRGACTDGHSRKVNEDRYCECLGAKSFLLGSRIKLSRIWVSPGENLGRVGKNKTNAIFGERGEKRGKQEVTEANLRRKTTVVTRSTGGVGFTTSPGGSKAIGELIEPLTVNKAGKRGLFSHLGFAPPGRGGKDFSY